MSVLAVILVGLSIWSGIAAVVDLAEERYRMSAIGAGLAAVGLFIAFIPPT